jgi:hypothetical protein
MEEEGLQKESSHHLIPPDHHYSRMRKSDAPLYMLMLFILVLVVLTLSEIAMVKHSGGVNVGRGGFHMTKKVLDHTVPLID